MIPVEYYWITLILLFGLIGSARGLNKELGTTAVVALSLFALYLGWSQAESLILSLAAKLPFQLTPEEIKAIYYSFSILFIAFLAYEGITLQFKASLKGFLKNMFGFFGGLFNGYLIIGTVWNVLAQALYFHPQLEVVVPPFSNFHQAIIKFLPVSFMENLSPIPFLILGMLLLLAMIFR